MTSFKYGYNDWFFADERRGKQEILGKCKALFGKPRTSSLGGQLSAFCERLSQRSTELSCKRFDDERSRKSKAIDEQRYGTVFCVKTAAHARVRFSYELRL